MKINGADLDDDKLSFTDHKISFPAANLVKGTNQISFYFYNTYVTNSAGFHRFEDPEDKKIYLYTHLEPFFCNRWFPCFDQPSIRAPLKL